MCAFNSASFSLHWFNHKLSHFFPDNRPLILNFGSCTWPSFMLKFHEFNKLIQDFGSTADFLIIYIEEAHAVGTVQTSQQHPPKLQTWSRPFRKKSILAKEGTANRKDILLKSKVATHWFVSLMLHKDFTHISHFTLRYCCWRHSSLWRWST